MKFTTQLVLATLSIFELGLIASNNIIDESVLERRTLDWILKKKALKKQWLNGLLGGGYNKGYDRTSNNQADSRQTNTNSGQSGRSKNNSDGKGTTIIVNNHINNQVSQSADSRADSNSDASSKAVTSQNNISGSNQINSVISSQRQNRIRAQNSKRSCSASSTYTCRMACGPQNIFTSRICYTTNGKTTCRDDSRCDPNRGSCINNYNPKVCYCHPINCSPPTNGNYQKEINRGSSRYNKGREGNKKPRKHKKHQGKGGSNYKTSPNPKYSASHGQY